jgi:hypothetical protein
MQIALLSGYSTLARNENILTNVLKVVPNFFVVGTVVPTNRPREFSDYFQLITDSNPNIVHVTIYLEFNFREGGVSKSIINKRISINIVTSVPETLFYVYISSESHFFSCRSSLALGTINL